MAAFHLFQERFSSSASSRNLFTLLLSWRKYSTSHANMVHHLSFFTFFHDTPSFPHARLSADCLQVFIETLLTQVGRVRHFTAEPLLRERCLEARFSTSVCSFTRFPAQHHDQFGSCCTCASKFFAATSAVIVLFLLFEAAATIDLSTDVVA